tara:strand:+ start:177 stop:365 length:189 start_codon:yes stop_codon:yes gene_type:complete
MLDKDIMTKFEDLKNKKNYPYLSGSIENVFYYYDKTSKHKDGSSPVIIRPDPVESKKKKSLT